MLPGWCIGLHATRVVYEHTPYIHRWYMGTPYIPGWCVAQHATRVVCSHHATRVVGILGTMVGRYPPSHTTRVVLVAILPLGIQGGYTPLGTPMHATLTAVFSAAASVGSGCVAMRPWAQGRGYPLGGGFFPS